MKYRLLSFSVKLVQSPRVFVKIFIQWVSSNENLDPISYLNKEIFRNLDSGCYHDIPISISLLLYLSQENYIFFICIIMNYIVS